MDEVATPTYYSSLLGFYSVLYALLQIPNESAQKVGYWKTTLDKNVNINAQGRYYGNALQTASLRDYKKIVKLLLSQNVNVNMQNENYDSVLSMTSSEDHKKIVKLLLS